MKKILLPLLVLLLLLTGCGKEKRAYGSAVVVETDPDAVVLRAGDGKETAFQITETTPVFNFVAGDTEKTLREGMELSVAYRGRRSSYMAANGTKYPSYDASWVSIDAVIDEIPLLLLDGTEVWHWKATFQDRYQLDDGTVLLMTQGSIWDQDSQFASAEANEKIKTFFADQGFLFEVYPELEKAYACYQARGKLFQGFMAGQETHEAAHSERALYFTTELTLPVSDEAVIDRWIGVVFDRENGEVIPVESLFTCSPEEIMAAVGAAAKLDDQELQETVDAFLPEYLHFGSGYLEIWFPAGTLPSHEIPLVIDVDLKDIEDILQPWAVPISAE